MLTPEELEEEAVRAKLRNDRIFGTLYNKLEQTTVSTISDKRAESWAYVHKGTGEIILASDLVPIEESEDNV